MTELNQEFTQTPEEQLESLKTKANLLGVSFHPNIKMAALQEKIDAHVAGTAKPEEDKPVNTVASERKRLREESSKLVRVNITPMDPSKREYNGEIFTVGNDVVGTFKRYVPFNTTDGWHVEKIILDFLKERRCQIFVTKKVNGREIKGEKEGKLIAAFGIEYLDPLTPKEIKELAQRQAMAAGGDD